MRSLFPIVRQGLWLFILLLQMCQGLIDAGEPLINTQPLTHTGDIASDMIDGIDRFLLQQIANSSQTRDRNWAEHIQALHDSIVPSTSAEAKSRIEQLMQERRLRLARICGVRDQRITDQHWGVISDFSSLRQATEQLKPKSTDSLVALPVRWPVLDGFWGEGLLIEPADGQVRLNVIALPDADQTPEQFAGLQQGLSTQLQFARLLASAGCRVVVPSLISRDVTGRGPVGEPPRAQLSNREWVYRPAFEMGRHVVGYEIQTVLAIVDLWDRTSGTDGSGQRAPIAVVGYGEGALIGLLAAALDTRIDQAYISGYFGPREQCWSEPVCRNLFGQLNEFGDAELAAMIFPRPLTIDFTDGPKINLKTQRGAPGKLQPPAIAQIEGELQRLWPLIGMKPELSLVSQQPRPDGVVIQASGAVWLQNRSARDDSMPGSLTAMISGAANLRNIQQLGPVADSVPRQDRLVQQLWAHTQRLLHGSAKVRKQFMASLDFQNVGAYQRSTDKYRTIFSEQVIGQFEQTALPANPRTRQSWESERWVGYEVMLDLFPNLFAYGVLLRPKDIAPGEKRPVVVCQHGLEGRPTDLFLGDHAAYHDYAAKLCDRGYIVFAPQNIYIFQDRFRTLQRKANPLGKTLFSVMIPQHQQIVRWLSSLPEVDSQRIAFYGLSYGGKSAMRIPAVVTEYCLSICSADFNEWILKNASTTHPFSYVWTGEYEIFEFDLGNTFNYAEMAALICPRPFMVERGHFDGVGEDEWVGHEYAKVQHLYQARLGIGDRARIEWFVGPHTIHAQGTFEFLDQHLNWHPKPTESNR